MSHERIQKIIQNCFGLFGLTVHKKSSRRFSLEEVLEQLKNVSFTPNTCFDVGVAYGTWELYEAFPDAKHVLIEPVQKWESTLAKIATRYDAEYYLCAATNKKGKITINVRETELGGTSLFEEPGASVAVIPCEVPAITLDDLNKEKNYFAPYLLKIDVQGAELLVLGGAKELLKQTDAVIVEVSLFKFYLGGPEIYDVISFMKNQGFVIYEIFAGQNRPFDQALAQVDLCFVKENGIFRQSHSYR